MDDPYQSSEPDHKAFLGEDDVPDFDPYREDLPPELSFLSGGDFAASEDPKDQFITGTAKGEMRTTADLARFLPPEDLAALNNISHPVKEEFLNPFLNANLSSRNLELIYRQWQEQEPNADLRKLAFVIATAAISSNSTLHCLAPILSKEDWAVEGIKAGFWKRGFTGLKGRDDYLQMSKEMGLDLIQFPSLVNIPSISVQIMGIGMFQTGFTSGRTLGDYFGRGKENWEGASEILGRKDGGTMGLLAQEILADIKAFLWSEEKGQGMEMTDYLILNGKSSAFSSTRTADAVRILRSLNYLPREAPVPIDDDEAKTISFRYKREAYSLLNLEEIGSFPSEALLKFQSETNKKYPFSEKIPETGKLDSLTYKILMCGGHQILCGDPILIHGFDTKLAPTNPFVRAFRDYREGDLGLVQLARLLLQYFPMDQPTQMLSYINQLTPKEAQRLSFELSRQSSQFKLALIDPVIREVMKENLIIADKNDWQIEIDRIQDISL